MKEIYRWSGIIQNAAKEILDTQKSEEKKEN
jgi:hypothetical protein